MEQSLNFKDGSPLALCSSLIPRPGLFGVYDAMQSDLWSSAVFANAEQLVSKAFDVVQPIENHNVVLRYSPVKSPEIG